MVYSIPLYLCNGRMSPRGSDSPFLPRGAIPCSLPAILLAIVCLLPFLNKPYTIDDPLFLFEARQILRTPLHPLHFEICWNSVDLCGTIGQISPNTALMGYALVPVVLAGGAEWLGHLMQIALASLALVAMTAFAMRLGFSKAESAVAAVLLAATPPFLSMASTVMPDILVLCLSLAGMERLAAWRAQNKLHQAVAAGVLLGLAPYGRLHVAMLIVVGAVFLCEGINPSQWIEQFRRMPRRWSPIAIALLIAGTLLIATRDSGHGGVPSLLLGARNLPRNILAYLIYLAVPLPFVIPWIMLHWREKPWLLWILPSCIGMSAVAKHYIWHGAAPIDPDRWFYLAVPFTVAVLVHLIWTTAERGDQNQLVLTLWLAVPLVTIPYVHLPIKYLVASMPAIILLLAQESQRISPSLRQTGAGLLIAAGLVFSTALLRADYRFAELELQAARQLITPYISNGQKVWWAGQWGFYWYASNAGANLVKPAEPEPQPGDLLAVGRLTGGEEVLRRFPNRTLIRTVSDGCACGRTVGPHAGLYTNLMGFSLWRWGTGEIDHYELWQLR